jgi:hypothetical protein
MASTHLFVRPRSALHTRMTGRASPSLRRGGGAVHGEPTCCCPAPSVQDRECWFQFSGSEKAPDLADGLSTRQHGPPLRRERLKSAACNTSTQGSKALPAAKFHRGREHGRWRSYYCVKKWLHGRPILPGRYKRPRGRVAAKPAPLLCV